MHRAANNPYSSPRSGNSRTESKRPGLLTAACLFLAFAALVWLFLGLIYSGERGPWYPLHLVVQAVLAGFAAWGMRSMKRWGVQLLALLAVAIQLLYLFTGLFNFETLIIYGLVLAPGVLHYADMT
jgi:hypothetical protein